VTLPMSSVPIVRAQAAAADGPGFYAGTFQISTPGDAFLDMRGWTKGTVWVNGHHLGRFWDIGPQQTLYVPGPWLRPGTNEVIVFTFDRPEKLEMRGLAAPLLNGGLLKE